MSERVVWGLDLGQTGLRAVKLERGKGGSVKMTDSFFCSIDAQPDDPQHEDKVREALASFVAAKQPRSIPAVLSLPGYTTLFRSFPLPAVPPSKLREVVYYDAKQLIPYPLEEVQWDFQQLGENPDTGELQIALLCCRRDIIDNLLKIADEAGLQIEDVQVGPLALVNYLVYDNPPQGRAMLLDCGARSTDFVMFDTDSFWLRSIAVCGDDISRTLMNKFSISFDEAEKLKSQMNDAKQAGRVFKVVEPVMRSLAGEAQRSFGYYRSTKRGASVDEMILAGNTFMMEGADQYMADALDYSARTLDMPATITVGAGVDSGELAAHRQVFGIAAGLALQGLGMSKFTCSLLPEARRLRKLIKKKEIYGWIAAALIVLTVLLALVTTRSQKPLFERDLAQIQQVTDRALGRQREYEEKMRQFEPAQKSNRAMLDVAGGRGMIGKASDLIHYQIESLNQMRFKKINPQAVSGLPQRVIIDHLRSNILNWPSSRQLFEKLLKEKTAEFKIDTQGDDETKKDMLNNLQSQVLRVVAIQHNRQKRTFLTNETYRVVRATKSGEGSETNWELSDADLAKDKPAAGRENPGNPNQPAAERKGGEAKNGSEEKEVVLVTLGGFTVTQDAADDLKEFNDRLIALKSMGLYLLNFQMLRSTDAENFNTINLPAIYDPTPKTANLDAVGENGTIDRSEKFKYEAFTKEKVGRFEARLVYEPAAEVQTKDGAAREEALIQKALKGLEERLKKPEVKPAEGQEPAKAEEKPEAAGEAKPAEAPAAK